MEVYTVMSILQGGCGMPIMAKPVFDYLSGTGDCTGINVSENRLPDGLLRIIVNEVGHNYGYNCATVLYVLKASHVFCYALPCRTAYYGISSAFLSYEFLKEINVLKVHD